jgi:hypothetical protein
MRCMRRYNNHIQPKFLSLLNCLKGDMGSMPIQNEPIPICYGYSTWYKFCEKKQKFFEKEGNIHAFDYIAIQVLNL